MGANALISFKGGFTDTANNSKLPESAPSPQLSPSLGFS